MKSEHHEMIEDIADTIMREYVTHAPLGWIRKENEIKKTLSPFASKIKEQQREIEEWKQLFFMLKKDHELEENWQTNEWMIKARAMGIKLY